MNLAIRTAQQPEAFTYAMESLMPEARSMTSSDFSLPCANLLGVRVSAVDLKTAVDLCDRWIKSSMDGGYICATGVHGVMEAQRDPEVCRALNHALMNVPDGMPMSWVGHLQGFRNMDRVFGPDLMIAMCRLSVERGYRNFLYGGNPGVAPLLSETLQRRIPGLQVVGTYTPPFRSLTMDEEKEVLAKVRELRPHIIWVGLSTPKQERFMAHYAGQFQVPLMFGVGAAFDLHTGAIRDCSPWIKRLGLQWLHRLMQDPRRLWKRYLRNNPAFLWHIAMQLLGFRQYPSGLGTASIGSLHSVKRP